MTRSQYMQFLNNTNNSMQFKINIQFEGVKKMCLCMIILGCDRATF